MVSAVFSRARRAGSRSRAMVASGPPAWNGFVSIAESRAQHGAWVQRQSAMVADPGVAETDPSNEGTVDENVRSASSRPYAVSDQAAHQEQPSVPASLRRSRLGRVGAHRRIPISACPLSARKISPVM